ncbi:GAF domain-containing protein [Saccharopolyspora sp. CA-218241]|uniref:GAF domain-containing protein n=1 Tax=Saccharopolyspora sp. CA-218241 TaxID=3240027 RepID=UPI003D991EBD
MRELRSALTGLVVAVPGAEMGCARLLDGLGAVHTDRRAAAIDDVQFARGDGPCVEAARSGRPVLAAVTEIRTFWPEFARAAREFRIRGVVAVPLVERAELLGTLSFYGRFAPEAEEVARWAGLAVIDQVRRERGAPRLVR